MKKETKKWWHKGIRFECQGSGKCCVSHDGYGFVYMTKEDRLRMAKALDVPIEQFTAKYCTESDGFYHLKDGENEQCQFLKNKQCTIYEGRPTQCRTWPFWPDVMNAKTWNKEVKSFCPGVGKGKLWSQKDIEEQLTLQQTSESSEP